MQVNIIENESRLFKGNVIRLSEWDSPEEIVSEELFIIEKYKPVYIFCAVDANEIAVIQYLEKHGYGFSEFRIHSWCQLPGNFVPHEPAFPYRIELVGNEEHLAAIKAVLEDNLPDDRFYNDPMMDKTLARQRELINIEKSFRNWPQEFILGLFNTQKNKLVAFRSGAFRSEKEASFYLYGVSPGHNRDHYSCLLDHYCIAYLYNQGVRIIHAVSTGFNTGELNRLIRHHGFMIGNTQVLMRKVIGGRESEV